MLDLADVEYGLYGEILSEFDFPDEITDQTVMLMQRLDRDDALAVHKCAEDLLTARQLVIDRKDDDTAEAVEKLDAMLAGLVPWLKRNGITHAINPGPPS